MNSMTAIQVSSGTFRSELSDLLSRVGYGGDRIVVERNGTPLAAVVPLKDLEILEFLQKKKDQAAVEAILQEHQAEGEF